MSQRIWLYFTIFFPIWKQASSVHPPKFLHEPGSINITEGLTATFNCTAHSIGFYWLINQRLPAHSYNSHRGLTADDRIINSATNLKEHLLHVPATLTNDGVNIQCFIFNQQAMPSNISVLMIQGRLSTVSEIEHTQLNNTSILLTYTPPSTLAGVPISNYSLEFGDKDIWTSGNNVVINIIPDDYCDTQLVTVSAWNGVGRGESLNYTYTLYHVPSPTFLQSNTLSYSTSGTTVLLHSKVNNTDCIGKRPTILTAQIKKKGEVEEEQSLSCFLYDVGNSSCPEVAIESDSSTVWSITVNITSLLQQKQHYTAQLVFSNNKGNITETVRTFSTFQIQEVNVTHTVGDLVCITCNFLLKSNVDGCYVVLDYATYPGINNETLFIPKKVGARCPDSLYRGYYMIYVYEGKSAVESSLAIIIDNIFINTTLIPSISSSTSSIITVSTTTQNEETTDSVTSTGTTNSYISSTSSLIVANSKTPIVNTAQGSGDIDSSLLIIIAFIIGIILTLTIVGLISLSYCLVKTKKKNKKLKIAELAATEKFKHADVLLQSLRLPPYHASSLSPSHVHHSPPPSSPTTEPMYDNIDDKKKPRIQAVNIQATLPEIQPCPAYSVPPALPPLIHRPNIGNMQQQGIYIERD